MPTPDDDRQPDAEREEPRPPIDDEEAPAIGVVDPDREDVPEPNEPA